MAPGASSTPTSAHSESRDTYFIIDFIETVISVDSKSQAKPYEGEALTIARKLSITLRSSFVVATTLQPLESRVTCEFAGTEKNGDRVHPALQRMFVEKNVYHDRTTTSEDRTPGRNLNSLGAAN